MLGAVAVAGGAGGGRVLAPCGELRFPALGERSSCGAESPRKPLRPQPFRVRFRQRQLYDTSVNV